jgi:hypothetical protein
MMHGLFKKLALAAPLVVCLPFGALAGEGNLTGQEDSSRIFEEFSLTSAATQTSAAGSCAPAMPQQCVSAPCVSAPCVSAPCVSAPPTCTTQCGDPGVACCDSGCCASHWQFISGVEATFFHASSHGADASSRVTRRNSETVDISNSEAFDAMTFSPRVFAGVQDDCWAVLGRFWYLSDSSGHLDPFVLAGSGTGTFATDRIKAYTADFEVRRSMCIGVSKFDFFLGGRYASFETDQGIDISRLTTGTEMTYTNAFTDFTFSGLGITTGFQGRTPIGCDSCISLVYGVRGSVLWGNAGRGVQTSASIVDVGASASSINGAYAETNDTAFIIEGLVGLQWDHDLRCLPMSAFFRIAGEYQFWDLGSAAQAAAGSNAVSNTASASSRASLGDVDANFFGFTIGTGFNW